jgi:hypothetical protein
VGVRVRGAQDRGVQRSGRHGQIVDIAAATGQERSVFDALDRPA